MRKALIAVITASALFAIGAFAATFNLTAEDTASGSDAVDACADQVLVEFNETFGTTDWNVASVDLTISDTTHTCANADIEVVLQDGSGGTLTTLTGTFPGTGSTTQLTVTDTVPVSSLANAAVLLGGVNIDQTP